MTSYNYYNTLPSWGTSQFQPVPPPTPQYQPSSSWTGNDYFRAHSGYRDNSIFDYVWYKLRDFVMGTGFSRNKAFRWWKKIYSGLVNPTTVLPKEIGAAAGFEAIRLWETHGAIYAAPLNADREREREALVGLAAAEATKLWAYTGRPYDKWGHLEASETAAATASRIFMQNYAYDSSYEPHNRFSRSNSFSRQNRDTLGRRRAATPNMTSTGAYRPATPYNGPSIVDTLASPVSSFGGNSLNMTGMGAALPHSPLPPRSPVPMGSPFISPLDGMGQGYIPPAVDGFPNDFDEFDDYEDDYEGDLGYGQFGGNFGGHNYYGGSGGSAYGGMGGLGPGGLGRLGGGGMRGLGGLEGAGGMGLGGFGGMGGGGVRGGGMRSGGMRGGGMGLGGFGGVGYGGMGIGSPGGMGSGGMVLRGLGGAAPPNYLGGGAPLGAGFGSEFGDGIGNYGNPMVNPSNVTYDPILGPGIQGTYYPKVAEMQRLNSGSYGYPGASVGLPPPPGTNSGWSRGGLRRSRSFY